VTEEIARLDLLPPYQGLAAADYPAVAAFLREYRERGHGPLVVASPPGENAAAIADEVRAVGAGMGIVVGDIALAVSVADAGSPYHLTFVRYRAHAPECGLEWPSLSQTARSETYANFGCAQAANLAAMIVDPRDLVEPRPMTPADATRRVNSLNAYRVGETFGGGANAGGAAAAGAAGAGGGADASAGGE
jgi:pilus assembly protein CpaD